MNKLFRAAAASVLLFSAPAWAAYHIETSGVFTNSDGSLLTAPISFDVKFSITTILNFHFQDSTGYYGNLEEFWVNGVNYVPEDNQPGIAMGGKVEGNPHYFLDVVGHYGADPAVYAYLQLTFSAPLYHVKGVRSRLPGNSSYYLNNIEYELSRLSLSHYPEGGSNATNLISFNFAISGKEPIVHAVWMPEPSAWALMLVGFGAIGTTLRRRPTLNSRPAS